MAGKNMDMDLILESIKQKIQEVESLMSKEDVLEKLNDVKLNLKEIAEKFQAFTTNRTQFEGHLLENIDTIIIQLNAANAAAETHAEVMDLSLKEIEAAVNKFKQYIEKYPAFLNEACEIKEQSVQILKNMDKFKDSSMDILEKMRMVLDLADKNKGLNQMKVDDELDVEK